MMRTILVPLDGSPVAEPGLTVACRLARATGAALLLVRVEESFTADPALQERACVALTEARDYLHRAEQDLARAGFAVRAELLLGEAADAILLAAHAQGVDAISLCTYGYGGTGHGLLGSVAESVLRRAACPVLITRAGAEIAHQTGSARHTIPAPPNGVAFRRILVPLDGRSLSEATLAYLGSAGLGRGAEVILLHVLEPAPFPAASVLASGGSVVEIHEHAAHEREQQRRIAAEYLAAIGRRSLHAGSWRAVVAAGYAAREIMGLARQEGVDLILMTSHGRTERDRLLHGSVTGEVVRHAEAPVLVLHGAETAAPMWPEGDLLTAARRGYEGSVTDPERVLGK